MELVQGIGDVPSGVEAGEGGGGGLEAEVLLDVLEGVGLGTGFEPGDDLLSPVGSKGTTPGRNRSLLAVENPPPGFFV